MTSEEQNWSNALLNAHFQSLNQAWSDRNSVILLLAEIRDYLLSDASADSRARDLVHRIEMFTSNAATRVDRQPMKPAGRKDDASADRKAG